MEERDMDDVRSIIPANETTGTILYASRVTEYMINIPEFVL
jgi:hypothetical protein